MSEAPYWLGFSLITTLGIRGIERLRSAFGDLQTAWEATEPSLALAGLDDRTISSVMTWQPRINVQTDWTAVEATGAHIVPFIDPRYPAALRLLADAPPVLTVRGTLELVDANAVTIVGTRDATRRGIDLAYEIAGELAVNNVTVISGFAKGVDAAAHKGALAAGGRTLAVLGNGITVVFPAEHAELAEQIAASGALISEFRYDARPDRGRFPRRNRTMSGMSRAVLVVEAPLGSGALLTAKAAREQGRTVFVVRGDAAHANQQGLMALIDAGAQPISDAHDIIDALNTTHNHAPPLPVTGRSELQSKGARGAFAPIPEIKRDGDPDNSISPLLDETGILNILGDQALHVDDIAQRLGVSPSAVLAIMTRLEMNGHIQIVGHSQYRRHFSSRAN